MSNYHENEQLTKLMSTVYFSSGLVEFGYDRYWVNGNGQIRISNGQI